MVPSWLHLQSSIPPSSLLTRMNMSGILSFHLEKQPHTHSLPPQVSPYFPLTRTHVPRSPQITGKGGRDNIIIVDPGSQSMVLRMMLTSLLKYKMLGSISRISDSVCGGRTSSFSLLFYFLLVLMLLAGWLLFENHWFRSRVTQPVGLGYGPTFFFWDEGITALYVNKSRSFSRERVEGSVSVTS